MTNKDITKIYFRGNEIVALYRGSTLIFKKSGGGSTTKPTGVYTVRGTLKPDSTAQSIELKVNGVREQFAVNSDKTFEYTFVNVPITNMDNFTLQCKDELKTLDLSDLDTSQVTSMIEAFYQCSNLTSIDLTNVNTSNVTNMSSMFSSCYGLTSLDVRNFDTSKVTDMNYMFYNCFYLTSLDLSNFDTSNVTDMSSMFSGCYGLTSLDVRKFNTTNVTNMHSMFFGCHNLTSLDLSNFDTSNVTDMSSMFYEGYHLTSLDLSNFDTSNVTSMEDMFNGCESLTSLDLTNFDTSKVTQMGHMFRGCESLTSLDLTNFDTSKVTRLQYMFYDDEKLTDLYINFDVRLNTYFETIFSLCFSLKNVVGKFEGTKLDLYLSHSPLTPDSAMVFINGLATVIEKRTLALSATTYDSLTNEQIAIATSKGWTVTRN